MTGPDPRRFAAIEPLKPDRRIPVTLMPRGGGHERLGAVVAAFPQLRDGVMVDVGCRWPAGDALPSERNLRYYGVDRAGSPDLLGDLSQGLPFANQSIDMLLALDVLEHVDDIHVAFAEVCRVARRLVAITLPNVYELKTRWRFLRGSALSGKYGLPDEAPADRHRWVFSLSEARRFCRSAGARSGFVVAAEASLVGGRRGHPIGRRVVARWPNLLAPTYGVLLQRVA